MDIKQLKATVQLAQLRHDAEATESTKAVLDAAKDAYEYALDPEKKTDGGDIEPIIPPVPPKKSNKPTPLVQGEPKPGAVKAQAKQEETKTEVASEQEIAKVQTPEVPEIPES